MKEWRRVPTTTLCGYCGHIIAEGVPALYVQISSLKRVRVRCQGCVGEAAPELPPRVVRSPMTKKMLPLKRAIPADYTNRLLGERD